MDANLTSALISVCAAAVVTVVNVVWIGRAIDRIGRRIERIESLVDAIRQDLSVLKGQLARVETVLDSIDVRLTRLESGRHLVTGD